jgi:hypothetical protein
MGLTSHADTLSTSWKVDKGGLLFEYLVENASGAVLACGPLPLSMPDMREVPRAFAQIPSQIMALRKQAIPLTHRAHERPPV